MLFEKEKTLHYFVFNYTQKVFYADFYAIVYKKID